MGAACCAGEEDRQLTASGAELDKLESQPILADAQAQQAKPAPAVARQSAPSAADLNLPGVVDNTYNVTLDKTGGGKLGLDVDYMEGRLVLPIMALTGGLAEAWNKANPETPLQKGDSIVTVNGISEDVTAMLEKCKKDDVLELKLRTCMTYEHLVADLEKLVQEKSCGSTLVLLSWHSAGIFSVAPPESAVALLSKVSSKYCPALISQADLWALAANVAIRLMGGPDIPTRFGRTGTGQQDGAPDGDRSASHLRELFSARGFDDRDVAALSGAHGFDTAWAERFNKFDSSYFKSLLTSGSDSGDLALVQDEGFKEHVVKYAGDQEAFFNDFANAWVRLQELQWQGLRDVL
jgi:L-ascorbate peroxidase